MDFDRIEEDFLKVEFLLKEQFYGIGYENFKEKYGVIIDIIGECILEPEYQFYEVEAMNLLKYLYSKLLEEYSEQIKDIPSEIFNSWIENQCK